MNTEEVVYVGFSHSAAVEILRMNSRILLLEQRHVTRFPSHEQPSGFAAVGQSNK